MVEVLAGFIALSFYIYGISCLFSGHMAAEFKRYGLARYRALTGALQIAGAIGLSLSLLGVPMVGLLAATGLALQMALGIVARLRIKDSWIQCFPAFFYFCLSAYLALRLF